MGRIRIVAGDLRGRRVEVPEVGSVRPTADRVREALFSILGPSIAPAKVLDLFAGSGALGLEALSRGAEFVKFVESNPEVCRVLRANVAALGVRERARVVAGDVFDLVRRGRLSGGPWDLVLADPPYGTRAVSELPAQLAERGYLAPGSRIVIEVDAGQRPDYRPVPVLSHVRRARYGRVALDFFHFPGSPE